MTTYYISGPMRGKPDYNRAQFVEVEAALIGHLYEGEQDITDRVINPARNFNGDVTLDPTTYLALDLKQVLESDVLVLLPGWRESEGARREIEVAIWTGKRFLQADPFPDSNEWIFNEVDISAPSQKPSVRADALDEAKALITGDRNNSYGPPWQDFARSAGALNAYGYRGPDGRLLESHDIAIMVIAIKLSRLMWTPTKRDSWVDTAGYAGCGLECAIHDEEARNAA